jgi:hypothetical protein
MKVPQYDRGLILNLMKIKGFNGLRENYFKFKKE